MSEGWDEIDAPKRTRAGRPKGRHNPNIDWELAERLYVEGELRGEAEHTERVYSSHSVIAKRAGTTKNNLEQRISRYKWREKRENFQRLNGIVPATGPNIVASGNGTVSRKPLRRDAESILSAYIDLFAEAVARKSIRYDTVADLDKAIRLLSFVRGQAESTKHTHVTVSLEVMQRRHRELRRGASHVSDLVSGVIDANGVEVVDGHELDDDEARLPAGWDEVDDREGAAAE